MILSVLVSLNNLVFKRYTFQKLKLERLHSAYSKQVNMKDDGLQVGNLLASPVHWKWIKDNNVRFSAQRTLCSMKEK